MKDLPVGAIEAISKYDGYKFKAGYKWDNVNLGDSRSYNDLSIRLNLVLTGDSFCLISYTKGGFTTSDIVDLVQYKKRIHICRYWPRERIEDTFALQSLLLMARNVR